MKFKYLRLIVIILIIIKMGVICNEFFHIYYGEIPDFLVGKNLSSSKSLHLSAVKKFSYFFVFEILIAILHFTFSMESHLIRISRLNIKSNKTYRQIYNETKYRLKPYMPGFLLVLSNFISNFQVLSFRDSVNYCLLFSAGIYVIFIYSHYWISFILLGVFLIYAKFVKNISMLDDYIVSNDIIPKIVRKWISDRNYILKTYHLSIIKSLNMGVSKESNIINIIIFGDWNSLKPNKEFDSVLFHELGHINYQTKFYHHVWLFIIAFVIGLGFYYIFNKFMKSKKNYTIEDMVYLFLYLQIITNPIISISINGFRQYHEYLSDSYAVDNGFKEGIKSFFKKDLALNYYQQTYTLLYGLLKFHHPSMLKRLNCL